LDNSLVGPIADSDDWKPHSPVPVASGESNNAQMHGCPPLGH